MHSIILIREANDFDVRVSIGKFLEAKNISFIVLKDRSEYSGFLIQQDLKGADINSIKDRIRTYSSQSCIFFEEGVMQTPQFREPKPFDFEDYDDSSISGASMEIDIDELINDASMSIEKCIKCTATRKQAVLEIANLWMDKIRNWVENNKS